MTQVELAIASMFKAKQDRDIEELRRTNSELRPLLENSQKSLRGEMDVNKLLPPSSQAQ